MKVFQIVAEDKDLDEAIPFTKKARMMKQAKKAAKGATKDEARQLEVELVTYLKTSKQKATVDAVQKYFDQKGLGQIAAPILKNYKTGKQSRKELGAKLAGVAKSGVQSVGSAVQSALGGQQQNQSMYEAEPQDILSRGDVKKIIKDVVAKGYGASAGFGKSRFAQDEPPLEFKPQRGGAAKASNDIMDKIKGLSPEQKQQLLGLL